MSALVSLEALYLYENELTGTIPDMSALVNLQHLSLNNKKLTGTIPDMSALVGLERLSLSSPWSISTFTRTSSQGPSPLCRLSSP